MHGDGYETGQVPLFHVFVRIFGLDPAQNMPFFLRLNYFYYLFTFCHRKKKLKYKYEQSKKRRWKEKLYQCQENCKI